MQNEEEIRGFNRTEEVKKNKKRKTEVTNKFDVQLLKQAGTGILNLKTVNNYIILNNYVSQYDLFRSNKI